MRRVVLGGLLIAVAAISGVAAFGALENLFADYQDSPSSTYLMIGLPCLALCVAALVSLVGLWRR
jgi:hypothetical protein